MQSAYDGLAAVGKASAMVSLFWTHVYAGPFALLGLYGILRPRKRTGHVVGHVNTDPRCGNTPVDDTSCVIHIAYRLPGETTDRTVEKIVTRTTRTDTHVDGTTVVNILPLSYVNGQAVDLYYEPSTSNPAMELSNDDWRPIGWIVFVIAAFFLVRAWIKYFLVQRFSAMAAMGGVSTVKNFASDLIRPMTPSSNGPTAVFAPMSSYTPAPRPSAYYLPPPPRNNSIIRINHPPRPSVSLNRVANKAARVTQLLSPYRGKRR